MSLLDRLSGEELPKLPVHQFWGSLYELAAGEISRAQIVSAFNLTTDDEVELDVIINKHQSLSADRGKDFVDMIHAIFILAEKNLFNYDTKAVAGARITNFT